MIIRTDILILPIFQSESSRNHTQLAKSNSLIKMSCMNIARHNCVKLQYTETMHFSLGYAIFYQLFSNMKSAVTVGYGVAGVADVSAAAYIVRMKNI